MRPLEIALVTLAVAGVAVGAGVYLWKRNEVQRPPERPEALKTADNEAARQKTIEAAQKAANDAAGKAGDIGSQIVNTIGTIKGFVDGLGSTFSSFGELFK